MTRRRPGPFLLPLLLGFAAAAALGALLFLVPLRDCPCTDSRMLRLLRETNQAMHEATPGDDVPILTFCSVCDDTLRVPLLRLAGPARTAP